VERAIATAQFLEATLAAGALEVADLQERARVAGLLGAGQKITDSKGFKAAKKKLGITSCREGFGDRGEWFWALPTSPTTALLEVPTDLAPKIAPVLVVDATPLKVPTDLAPKIAPVTLVDPEGHCRPGERDPLPDRSPDDGQHPALFEWAEGVACLDPANPPGDVPPHRWRQFVDDCKAFLSELWAGRAVELGWDAASLFGCSPVRPLDHLGRAGLLWNMGGGKLTRLYSDWAVILAADGAERVFQRRPATTKVTLPWRLRYDATTLRRP